MNPCSEEEYYYKLDSLVLTACQHVRKVFANRWRSEIGEEWTDDKEQVPKFLKGAGARALQKAEPFQKNVLKNKDLEEWDIQLMFLILQNLGGKEKYKEENDAVYTLKQLRNELAHHATKKIPKQEFDRKLADFQQSLKSLGVGDNVLKQMVEQVELTSSLRAAEAVEKLNMQAEEFLKKAEFDKAVDCLSQAVDMPSLTLVDRGIAFEKRAECFLTAVKNVVSDQDKCDHALRDAKRALELNEASWKAHHLAAKCYQQKNNLTNAKHHYERALDLSPGQTKVKNDFDSCKLLIGEQNREDHLCPRMMPMSLQETLVQVEEATGRKWTKDQFFAMNYEAEEYCKGSAAVFDGWRFYCGWDASQSFTKAAESFRQAAAVKNAEGMYRLAMCYYQGTGVNQDIPKALEILREVAAMDERTIGEMTPLKYNAGVAWSELALGLAYADGVGVERDYRQVAKWYQKAMEHGSTSASCNLGLLYLEGRGVPKDKKMAEYCFKQAVNLKCSAAPVCLMELYLNQMEPEKAEVMMRIGRQLGNDKLLRGSAEEEFQRRVKQVKAKRGQLEPGLVALERAHELETKGLTFMERLKQVDVKMGNKNGGNLERRRYLESPTRKALFLEHRNLVKGWTELAHRLRKMTLCTSAPPQLVQPAPQKMSGAKPITLVEMNPTEDHVFVNRTLDLTILDDPNVHAVSINLIAEDDNGDVTRLYIYNVAKTKANLENFQPGCRIGIVNPYVRIGAVDASNGIRNDEPRCLVYLEKVEDMCRFCGEGNARYKCSKCKRLYCSKECKTLDGERFQHALICGLKMYKIPN